MLPDFWGHVTYNLETSVGVAQEFDYGGLAWEAATRGTPGSNAV